MLMRPPWWLRAGLSSSTFAHPEAPAYSQETAIQSFQPCWDAPKGLPSMYPSAEAGQSWAVLQVGPAHHEPKPCGDDGFLKSPSMERAWDSFFHLLLCSSILDVTLVSASTGLAHQGCTVLCCTP